MQSEPKTGSAEATGSLERRMREFAFDLDDAIEGGPTPGDEVYAVGLDRALAIAREHIAAAVAAEREKWEAEVLVLLARNVELRGDRDAVDAQLSASVQAHDATMDERDAARDLLRRWAGVYPACDELCEPGICAGCDTGALLNGAGASAGEAEP